MGTATKQHGMGGDGARQGTSYRQPLNAVNPNIYGQNNNVGMSAGIKVGRPLNGPFQRTEMPIGRPPGYTGLHGR